jgi:hypothetical protein
VICDPDQEAPTSQRIKFTSEGSYEWSECAVKTIKRRRSTFVSYIDRYGQDLSGKGFRHGEQVACGERLVPTTNFVLHWITGKSEAHRYDESLKLIDLVTGPTSTH